ncbi:alpha/beta hydrolase [uncultured Kordia sp.]|uniref:alpha/beta fold hydrolase n=1 Tax=uncultured Kordia sp. TaxID=507699 RepID=UPI00262DB2FB|nr:alpha/beta hydrolase [uncultured Kordia sp.]
MKEIEFNIHGFVLKAKTWGDKNGQPILGIHGWLDNANSFDKIAPLLAANTYFIAIDLAGHGLSNHRKKTSSYYLWDYALDILEIIEQLQSQKVNIIAHSMGTGVAAIIAGAFPKLIHKLVFIDGLGAPFVVKEENMVHSFHQSVRQLKMARKTKLYGFSSKNSIQFASKEEAIQDRMKNQISTISYDASACLTARSLTQVSSGYRWRNDPRIALPECYKMTEMQAQLFIEAIACETLIILGKQGLFSKGMFLSRVDKFKNATLHWLEGGHHLHLEEQHANTAQLINDFL